MDHKAKAYFECGRGREGHGLIDDPTAADLLLDDVFDQIDRTVTTPGRAILYHWLRTPCLDEASLGHRTTLVHELETQPELIPRISEVLSKLGRQDRADVASLLWVDRGDGFWKYRGLLYGFLAGEVSLVVLAFLVHLAPLLVVLGASLANLGWYLATTKHVGRYAASIRYVGRMFSCLRRLSKVTKNMAGNPDAQEVRDLAAQAGKVPSSALLGDPGTSIAGDLVSMALEYIRIFLLGELRAYFRFYAAYQSHYSFIERAYEVLGRFDASVALVRLRASGVQTSTPEFVPGVVIRAEALVHPLVPDFVPLDFEMPGWMVVTGSNMAGKSTFLRTLGLNQVLATTLGTVCGGRFETGFAVVMTSIGVQDRLLEGKSRYLAEAERLLFLFEQSRLAGRLILIDEILSGTNSTDRITASVGILRYLATTGCQVVASTHDTAIAEALIGAYAPAYFSELLEGDDLAFDYRLHPGVVDRGNALRILEKLGFDRAILGL